MSAPRRPGGGDDRRPPRRDHREPGPRRPASDGDAPRPARDDARPPRPVRTPALNRPVRADRVPRADTVPRADIVPRADKVPRGDPRRAQSSRSRGPNDPRPSRGKAAAPGRPPRGDRDDAPVQDVATRETRPPRPRAADTRPPRPVRTRPAAGDPRAARDARPQSPRAGDARPVRSPAAAGAVADPAPTPARTTAAAAAAAPSRREPQRIAKLLARAGIASRREVERMIAEGRIAIDGVVLDTPATVIASLHGVTVDGAAVDAPAAARLFLFNKPTGFLTTAHDPKGRPTIYDRLPRDLPRVMPVGRLDINTEGLLLLTTDGELKRKLELPSSGIPRIYRARAYGEVTQDQLEALIEGVEIEGVRYGQIDANLERRTGRNVWIEMRLTEGKNREVRRVLEYLGLQVSRLIRVAYGEFILADLAPGAVVEVRQNDLVAFRQSLR